MTRLQERLEAAAAAVREMIGFPPEAGLVLGSGLGELTENISVRGQAEYSALPGFPVSTVIGHAGRLIWGEWGGKRVVAFQGRFHFYEGYRLSEVTFPVWLMKLLGCRVMITTNAAGSLNPEMPAGSIMVVTSHINLLGGNPLTEPDPPLPGPRFVDLSRAYTPELVELALRVAAAKGIALRPGVLTAVSGPNFETAAEYRACRWMGADAVGMSVIPEVIVAAYCGLKTLVLTGLSDECYKFPLKPLIPEEVLAVARKIAPDLASLLEGVLPGL